MITLFLLGFVSVAFGDYYPSSYFWDFKNYSYLGFSQAVNFASTPHQGVTYDDSLVGYWRLDEGAGLVAHDDSGKGNDGTLVGASWVDGKFGKALSFNGSTNYVDCGSGASLNITGNSLSIAFWANFAASKTAYSIIAKDNVFSQKKSFEVFRGADGRVYFDLMTDSYHELSTVPLSSGVWYFIVCTYDGGYMRIYVNDVAGSSLAGTGNIVSSPRNLKFGTGGYNSAYYNGTLDEVMIYDRALSANMVASLYTMGPYVHPDSVSFANYYSFIDPLTNNTILVYVKSPNANSNNIALVTCTNFFAGNSLAFQANNSATVNVWTNLGRPAFTAGVWNSGNYTTTLTLDPSSTAELNWNTYNITTYVDTHSGVSPSNVTVGYSGSQTFNFNASQGYRFNVVVDGVSQGQISSYTFSNVTEPHSINVTSVLLKYTVAASADLGSTISPSGDVLVNYGGSQLFTVQNKTGYKVTHVYVDDVDKGAISNYTFSNVTGNHVISVSSESLPAPSPSPSPTATPTPKPSQSPEPTNSPSSTPTSQPETNQFPTQTAAIAAVAIVALIAGFGLAFKKGYITIETVDEENPEGTSDDYTI
jgi:hypothetical protein